jgi:acetylornithine aminotransferase
VFLPLSRERAWLPDLDRVTEAVWGRASVLWINYPHNPTGAGAPAAFLKDAVARARRHGVLLASDEAYAEIYEGAPPLTALAYGAENVLVLHSLSKRSGMAGYRSGFLAGDARLVEALQRFRPLTGCATPEFVQAAATAAWNDEAHAALVRERFRERRRVLTAGLRRLGWEVPEAPGAFYLWVPVPEKGASGAFAARCLEEGVVVLPGAALGPSGEGYVRLSLTAEVSDLEEALRRLAKVVR